MSDPLCFVLMPFGQKPDATGAIIDFDAVYHDLIAPAIKAAKLEPLRADEEKTGGIIHKPMFERLILCEFAVADLTTANANVFYELGVRHAVRPWSTVLLFAEGGRLPFDVGPLRALPYKIGRDGKPADLPDALDRLSKRLLSAREEAAEKPANDSPIYQLVEGFPGLDHTKTDVFRDRVQYATGIKERLAQAREQGIDSVRRIERDLDPIKDQEAGVIVDLFLSYRALKGWKEMIALVDKMPRPLAATVMIQEQFALALNRDGQADRAEKVLQALLKSRGPSSETYGILGRVYKDQWEAAFKEKREALARGLLDKAIKAYLSGFEADWRDHYPGINAVTLMELKEPPDPRRERLIPVVTYAVERRVAAGEPDYWDFATLLELAVLAKDETLALEHLSSALASVRESWEPETTARNLRLVREARERRGENASWVADIESELARRAQSLP